MRHFYFLGDRRRSITYKLFRSWHDTLQRYEEAWGTEGLLYIHTQQANTGLLSIAVAKAGWLPLLEFSTRGRRKGEKRKNDFSILWGKGRKIWIKADLIRVGFEDAGRNMADELRAPLDKVVEDLTSFIVGNGQGMGILFLAPYGARKDKFSPAAFKKSLFEASKLLMADFCIIHFCRYEIWSQGPDPDCPGIAAIGKHIYL